MAPTARILACCSLLSIACAAASTDEAADGPSQAEGDDGDVEDPVPSGPVTLAFAGDTMLARDVEALLQDYPEHRLFQGFEDHLEGVDVFAVNLETALTDHDEPWPDKNFTFKMTPSLAPIALSGLTRDTGAAEAFTAVANNHSLDFHVEGMRETIVTLDELGMPHAGAGENATEARAPRIIETATGVRVAIFSAATVCNCGPLDNWNATDQAPGAWMIDPDDDAEWNEAVAAVRAVVPDVDWIVFSLHWGVNWVDDWPVAWMQDRGQQLVDAGVDAIYGHSSHHILPLEVRDDAVVMYGMGDLINDYGIRDGYRNDLSYIGRVTLTPGAPPDVTVIPMRHEDPDDMHFTNPLSPEDPDYDLVLAEVEG